MDDDVAMFFMGAALAGLISSLIPPVSVESETLDRAATVCQANDGVESVEAPGILLHGGIIRCVSGAKFAYRGK